MYIYVLDWLEIPPGFLCGCVFEHSIRFIDDGLDLDWDIFW
jgi:hypothetical protein